jgi:hypothetical protein
VQFIGPRSGAVPLESDELAGCMPPSDGRVAGSVPGMQYHTKVIGNGCITLAEKDLVFTLALAAACIVLLFPLLALRPKIEDLVKKKKR